MALTSVTALTVATVGCVVGSGEDDIVVTLEQTDENFRDLPVIASGKVSLLGQDVADSHGTVAATVRIEGADRVLMESFELGVTVAESELAHELVRVRVNDADAEFNLVGVPLTDGDVIRADYRAKQLAEILQPQGEPYTASLNVSWREDGAFEAVQFGDAPLDVDSFIAASVNASSFAIVASEPQSASLAVGATAAQMRASVEVKSGLTVDVSAARLRATFFGVGELPALGLALVDTPALQIDGAAATTVAPAQVVDVYTSSAPSDDAAPESAAGTAASTGDVSGGKALVTIELDYTPSDGTAGLTTDVLTYVADVP